MEAETFYTNGSKLELVVEFPGACVLIQLTWGQI